MNNLYPLSELLARANETAYAASRLHGTEYRAELSRALRDAWAQGRAWRHTAAGPKPANRLVCRRAHMVPSDPVVVDEAAVAELLDFSL